MKWRIKTKPYDYADWHLWFAWKPVQVKSYKYWLCLLQRRAKFTYLIPIHKQKEVIKSGKDFIWEYELPLYYY